MKLDVGLAARGVTGQFALLDQIVTALDVADFERPTRLGTWRVAELVAHIGISNVSRYLVGPSAARAAMDTVDWVRGCAAAAALVDERAVAMTEEARPAELRTLVRETRIAIDKALLDVDPAFVVPARFGDIGVVDYLATRCVELTVHALDLTAAVGREPALDDAAVSVAVKLLLNALAVMAPGKAVEVRVPPYGAVQCVEGPRHTRGTPGNVIEMNAVTWLEVSTGRIDWKQSVDDGRVHASGERADLSALLPLLS